MISGPFQLCINILDATSKAVILNNRCTNSIILRKIPIDFFKFKANKIFCFGYKLFLFFITYICNLYIYNMIYILFCINMYIYP